MLGLVFNEIALGLNQLAPSLIFVVGFGILPSKLIARLGKCEFRLNGKPFVLPDRGYRRQKR